jgi:hypothetical protein
MIDFGAVEQSVQELKAQLADGTIDEETFESRLLGLIGLAPDGYYWMLGHESGRWFWHDGTEWLRGNPSEIDKSLPQYGTLISYPPSPQMSEPEWASLNLGWFVISLMILAIIGGIVYNSSPI